MEKTLLKAMTQTELTEDTVDEQYCSDWLKDQIKRLFKQRDMLRAELIRHQLTSCMGIDPAVEWRKPQVYIHVCQHAAGDRWEVVKPGEACPFCAKRTHS